MDAPDRRRWLEAGLITAAALLVAWALTWPLAHGATTGARPRGVDTTTATSAPEPWLLPLDDSYIFLRYSQQLARGQPFEWSPGEHSTGASSFLYPLLLLPGHWLADDLAGWSRWARGIGTLGLALLGLAGGRWLRQLPVPEPWPLVGGLALVLCGPIGLVSIAGMESAWNAAALIAACTLGAVLDGRESSRRQRVAWMVLVSLLPLIRPENALVTALAAGLVALGGLSSLRRGYAALLLVPGLGLALLNRSLTGLTEPTGAIVKSWLASPFLDLPGLWTLYWGGIWKTILPVYAGLEPWVLWPPVGWIATATAATALARVTGARRLRPRLPAAVALTAGAWACLVLAGPLSSHLRWQWMRHHHSALALAWLLAIAGLALALERWAPNLRKAALLIPLLLLLTLPRWVSEHTRLAWTLAGRHGPAATWLADQPAKQPLLLNDAGLLAVAHDGPAIDVFGLGTPALAHAHRHGAGATVEALARHPVRPAIAAVNLENFDLPQLLGERLTADRAPATEVARVRTDLIERTALDGPGLDFGYLPDERRWHPTWIPGLARTRPWSIALAYEDKDGGTPTLQGCRPVVVALGIAIGNKPSLVTATSLAAGGGTLRVRGGSRQEPHGEPLLVADLPFGRWARIEIPPLQNVWLEAGAGTKLCVESILLRTDR